MARQDEVEHHLVAIAPLFRAVALYAQDAAKELSATDWATKYLARTAAFNQVAGTARWRVAGDEIVRRRSELPPGIEVTTDDGEQNQGRYYLGASEQAVVFTIRRKPHTEKDQPEVLQLQMKSVLEQAPITYEDAVAVYLAIPPVGEPHFEVVTGTKHKVRYLLAELIARGNIEAGGHAEDAPNSVVPSLGGPRNASPSGGVSVSSSKKRGQGAPKREQK
jgi:hypothetical protein